MISVDLYSRLCAPISEPRARHCNTIHRILRHALRQHNEIGRRIPEPGIHPALRWRLRSYVFKKKSCPDDPTTGQLCSTCLCTKQQPIIPSSPCLGFKQSPYQETLPFVARQEITPFLRHGRTNRTGFQILGFQILTFEDRSPCVIFTRDA